MWMGLKLGLDRDLKLLLFEMSSRRLVMSFLEVVRAIYFALIGFSPVAIGLLLTVGTAVSALESLFFGTLSDRIGRKPFLIIGGVFSVLRLILYAVSQDFWVLVLAQGIGALGEGAGAGQPVVSGYIADKTPVWERSRIFSVLAVANAISATAGSLMAVLPAYFQLSLRISEVEAHALLFWLGAAINFSATFILLPMHETRKNSGEDDGASSLSGLNWRELGKYCIIRTTDGLGMGLASSLLPLYFYLRFGADAADLAPIYALPRFLAIFSYLLVPFFVKRFGNIRGLIISRVVTGVAIVAFALAPDFQAAALLFVTYTVLFEFAMPMRQSFATEIVKPSQTGTVIGVSNAIRSLLRSFDPMLAGYLFEFASFSIPLFISAVLLAINGAQYHIFYRKKS